LVRARILVKATTPSLLVPNSIQKGNSIPNKIPNIKYGHKEYTKHDLTNNKNKICVSILLNNGAKSNYLEHGIHTENITEAMSDHYLIWVKFRI
jgi:hypothetical protein